MRNYDFSLLSNNVMIIDQRIPTTYESSLVPRLHPLRYILAKNTPERVEPGDEANTSPRLQTTDQITNSSLYRDVTTTIGIVRMQ